MGEEVMGLPGVAMNRFCRPEQRRCRQQGC